MVGPPLAELGLHLSKTIPSMSSVSSMVPPIFLTSLISLRSTLTAVCGSMTLRMASTAIGDKSSQLEATTFELREVLTHSMRVSLLVMSTGMVSDSLIT
mgnify:CR=1 FL=1